MQGSTPPLSRLGRNFGGQGVTWTFTRAVVDKEGRQTEVIVVEMELGNGTLGFMLTVDDAKRFADLMRSTAIGLAVVQNGAPTPEAS